MIIPELLRNWHSNDIKILKIIVKFKGIIKLKKELGSMAVVKHSREAKALVQCMNVDESTSVNGTNIVNHF